MALSFLKSGAESAKIAQQEKLESEKRKQESGKMFRFWLSEKEEARITFVDGDLSTEHGVLLPPRFYEHNLYLNGKWGNLFVCPRMTNPGEECCICDFGDRPSLIALFTIIDHRQFKSTKDPNKVYVNTRKILAAKTETFEVLNKHAIKRGGLVGTTWDVSRIGEKAASVGNMFDFVGKGELATLQAQYVEEVVDPKTNAKSMQTYFLPADYEKEIIYRDNNELLKLGLGNPSKASAVMVPQTPTAQVNYSSVL